MSEFDLQQRNVQNHKIMRQVLELEGCTEDNAQQLQSVFRETYYQRLLPIIEKACSDLSAPGKIERIPCLELDLEEFPLEKMMSSSLVSFEEMVYRKLKAQIKDSAETIDADLELLNYFLHTGTTPWWAQPFDQKKLNDSLERLLDTNITATLKLLRTYGIKTGVIKRFVNAYPDRLLNSLLSYSVPEVFAPDIKDTEAWLPVFSKLASKTKIYSQNLRQIWWEEILGVALYSTDKFGFDVKIFYRHVLGRLAVKLEFNYRDLLVVLQEILNNTSHDITNRIANFVQELSQEQAVLVARNREYFPLQGTTEDANLNQQSEQEWQNDLKGVTRETSTVKDTKEGGISRLSSAPLGTVQSTILRQLYSKIELGKIIDYELWQNSYRLIEKLSGDLRGHLLSYFKRIESEQTDEKNTDANIRERLLSLIGQVQEVGLADKTVISQSIFSDTDTIYVSNAGLVVLWPFLQNFFRYQGLIEEKHFKDEYSLHRAVGLLQFLASGDEHIHEAQLPLNKILCGLEPESVFDLGPEISQDELQGCHELLQAAIQQAPILRGMSIAGFRYSFLLRQGQLSAMDEHWLLRVERETHDVVLDRFPWGLGIVKLPWMDSMLQVEW